jgi:hypothetical protein
MPAAMILTPFEAGRLFAADYAGKRARLCLANTAGGLPGINSTTAQWDGVELSGNGYVRFEWTIPAGSYNSTTERFEANNQLATFGASAGGAGLSWNAVYLVIGTLSGSTTTYNSGVSFILNEGSTITLAAGDIRGYYVQLFSDGFLVTA